MRGIHWVVAVVIVLLAVVRRSPRWYWRSRADLKGIFPVYSAATVRNKESEFIRDRLPQLFPKRFPLWLFSMALLLLVIATWLLLH